MDNKKLRSGSKVSAEATEDKTTVNNTLTPREYAYSQRNKFLENKYTHRVAGNEYPWVAYNAPILRTFHKRVLAWFGSISTVTLNLAQEADWNRFNQLMGRANRSPRMSMTNLFKRENIQVQIERNTKLKQVTLRVGVVVDNELIGVCTTYKE